MSRTSRFLLALLALLVLGGCTPPQEVSLGPTGNSQRTASKPDSRESYLIPPEIPASLLTYLFNTLSREREITSIRLLNGADNIWTLDITVEQLSDGVFREVHRFAPDGSTWRSL